jgi:S-methylmethionine-dependent homocysteine/selenocysteine methylase
VTKINDDAFAISAGMKYSRIISFFHQLSKTGVSTSSTRDRIILLDGGLGEELLNHGVPYDATIWSARAIAESQYHAVVKKVHTLFLDAGAQCITTNSYGIVPGVGFTKHQDIEDHGRTAGQLARSALDSFSNQQDRFVLGSLGPLVESYRPDRILSRNEGSAYYTTLIRALQPYEDAFIAETLSTTEEARQVLDAIAFDQKPSPPPLLISFTVGSHGRLRSQEELPQAFSDLLDYWEMHTPNVPRE